MWDTSGQENYERLRPLAYSGAHVILLCFKANNPTAASKNSILQKWTPELMRSCPGAPVILVGLNHPNDSDDEQNEPIGSEEEPFIPFSIRREIGAPKYFFCDPVTGFGVDELLEYVSETLQIICPALQYQWL
jgi:GTPase SAR1 family protein